MPDPVAPNPKRGRHGDPNFLEVVVISGVALLLFFIGAGFVLMHSSKDLLPALHPDHEPHSTLQMPFAGAGTRAA